MMEKNRFKEKKVSVKKIRITTVIILFIGICIILFLGGLTISFFKNNKELKGVDNKEITSVDITKKKQEKFEVTKVNISKNDNLTSVVATVKNIDNEKYKSISIDIIFYDSKKSQVAVAKGLIENIEYNEQKSFSSYITGDYTKGLSYEVKIGEVIK